MEKSNFAQILSLAVLLLLLAGCNESEEGIKAEYRPLTEAVYATVKVVPEELYTVYATVAGIIEEKDIEEGDLVAQGQRIFQLKNSQSAVSTANARLNLEQARDNYNGSAAVLRELETQLETARLRMRNDSLQFARQARLWSQNIGSEQAYTDRQLAYEMARNELQVLENSYARSQEELANRVAQAQNNLQLSTLSQGDFAVKARIDGQVYSVLREAGETVTPQTPLATIGRAGDFILELEVDEVDISRVRIGQRVVIRLDAYPGECYLAEVSKMAPSLDGRSQTFLVEAVFEQAPERLYNGLSGEANIVIAELDEVLTIPANYLLPGNQVATDEGLQAVEVGLENLSYVQITAGLDTSTFIYPKAR